MKTTTLLIIALCTLALALACFPLTDADTWWHLAAGRLIANAGLPTMDTWTYTADKPWIDLYWLPQLIFYGLYSLGGVSALVLLKMVAAGAIVALVLATARKPSWAAVLVVVPALVLVTGRLRERPELFSLVYLAVFLTILAKVDGRPRLLWVLPAVQVLWANSHGLFVLGPALLSAHLAASLVERRPWKVPALVTVTSLAACLVNPYGPGVFTHLAQQAGQLEDGLYRRSIAELQTFPELVARSGLFNPYVLAALALFGAGLWGFAARRAWPRVFPALIFVASSYMAWRSVRLVPVFAIMTAAFALVNHVGTPRTRARAIWPAAVVAAFVALVVSGAFYRWSADGRTVGVGEARGAFAHEACAFLAKHGPPRVIVANITQASVCTWHLRPDQRQFLMSRVEPAKDDAFENYVSGVGGLLKGRSDWESSLGIHYTEPENMPAIMIERELALAANNLVRDPRWVMVYRDEMAAVFFLRR